MVDAMVDAMVGGRRKSEMVWQQKGTVSLSLIGRGRVEHTHVLFVVERKNAPSSVNCTVLESAAVVVGIVFLSPIISHRRYSSKHCNREATVPNTIESDMCFGTVYTTPSKEKTSHKKERQAEILQENT